MNKLLTSILSLGFAASAALAANPAISAVKVTDDLTNVDGNSAVWAKAKYTTVNLYPQMAIEMNDKNANEANENNKAKAASVAALYDGKNIALSVKWLDKTKDVQAGYATTTYGDGFAIQFAGITKGAQPLPYIGMGSTGRPVVVHLQKANEKVYEPNGNGDVSTQLNRQQTGVFGKELAEYDAKVASLANKDYERVFVGEGFRSLTEIKDKSVKSNSSMSHDTKGWSGTLVRPLKDDYVNMSGTVPVAIAVWDGSKMGRNGVKNLSSWVAVNLEGQKPNAALVADLTTDAKGDAANGKVALETNGCNGCHQMSAADPKSFMAPSLKDVGGYSTASYLRESILKPSAVVVPGYNRNAHANTPWYNIEKGKRISTMTDFSHLDKKSVDDIVAYLQTLKAEVE
ncbi:MAG: ethylbenzene dehydrogenase-related protein [Sulfuricurvum sp.]|uniref:ethylbenzene dehydrogenase-related protein n=1 Tax=Sulfuricurvum sp. TaxID=2025608 RepID=UPI0026369C7E|nr:ethylbenzene dehydrogenase-related protein [Sulfuricurvum sp.]MDD2828129.1 ethylbenzene dehydrogenase-related protein [Sulfuricurvum sp.]MDD4947997.1 ethylbenzene dehydrogenase-related protein [Sulfuricurvum sp.]